MLNSGLLKELHAKVADDAYVLYEAVEVFGDEETNGDSVEEAISQCVDYVHSISESAKKAELTGLQKVCEITEQHLFELQTEDKKQRIKICGEIERFPQLIASYLQSPTDSSILDKLLTHLKNEQWQDDTLTKGEINDVSNLLLEDFVSENDILETEQLSLSPEEMLSYVQSEFKKTALENSNKTTQNTEISKSSLPDDGSENMSDDNIRKFESKSKSQESHDFSDFDEEAISPSKSTRANLLQEKKFFSGFIEDANDSSDIPVFHPAKHFEILSDKVSEINDLLSASLNKFVTSKNESDDFLEAVEEYTNIVQSFWELAEEKGFLGLQNICTFINDNIFELCSRNQSQRLVLHTQIALWPKLILDYFHKPSENVSILIGYLRGTDWLVSLSESQANRLAKQLTRESYVPQIKTTNKSETPQQSEKSASSSQIDSEKTSSHNESNQENHDNLFNDELSSDLSVSVPNWGEEDLSPDLEETATEFTINENNISELEAELEDLKNLEDELPIESTDIEEQENALADIFDLESENEDFPELSGESDDSLDIDDNSTNIQKQEETDAFSDISSEINEIEDDIFLTDSDILDFVNVEIAEATDDLSNALRKFILAGDDSTELLEAVEQYTDNVQSILDTAVTAGLEGIPEICDFVNENILELSAQPQAVRRAAQSHIEQWPILILSYLHLPLQNAQNLVSHLRSPIWLFPLDDDRSQALLSQLTHGKVTEFEQEEITESEVKTEDIATESEELLESDPLDTALESDEVLEFEPLDEALESDEILESDPLDDALESEEILESDPLDAALESDEILESDPLDEALESDEILESDPLDAALESDEILESDPLDAALESDEILESDPLDEALESDEILESDPLDDALESSDPLDEALESEEILESDPLDEALESDEILESDPLDTALESDEILESDPLDEALESEEILESDPLDDALESDEILESDPLDDVLAEMPEKSTSSKISVAPPEIIELLIGQISDTESDLTTIFNNLILAEDESDALFEQVGIYTELVQSVWDAADMAKLSGVQEVCTFINDNIMALSGLDKASRQASQDVFLSWLPLVVNYLQEPESGAIELIEFLKGGEWPTPLDVEQAENLQHSLLATEISEESSVPKESLDNAPTIVLASPETIELLIAQITDIEAELAATYENFIIADDESEALFQQVGTYTELVQSVWDSADMAKLGGVQTVCDFINENIMALSGLDKTARSNAQGMFLAWTQQLQVYLQEPTIGAEELVKDLQSSNWPSPLDETQANELQSILLKPAIVSDVTEKSFDSEQVEQPYLAAPETIDLVRGQITDIIEELSSALEDCVSMKNESESFLKAVENYTSQVESIHEAAGLAGLEGLQEICTFVNDNLMELIIKDKSTKQATQPYFERWPASVLEYLNTPIQGAESLVNLLQESAWPMPLVAERVGDLSAKLTKSSTVSDYEDELLGDDIPDDLPLDDLPLDDLPLDDLPPDDLPLDDLPPDDSESEEMSDIEMEGDGGDISLGNSEMLEILSEALTETKQDLDTALERIVTLSPGEPAFEESAENYVDDVQRLWTAAEMMGLEGLQTICTFVSDNVKVLATQDAATRKKAQPVLAAWPDLVLSYLGAPADNVIPMLNHFRESEWANPLADEQAHSLLQQLTQGSTAEEVTEEEEAYQCPTVANAEDVLVEIPEDINPELLEAYLSEAPQHAAEFSESIQSIIQDPQVAEIHRAQRIAHTLKGSSNIIGIKGVANIAHRLEDTLEYLEEKQVAPPEALTDMMVEAADCLESMIDSLTGQGEAPSNAQQIFQSVLDWTNRILKGQMDAPPTPTKRPAPATETAQTSESSAKPQAEIQEKKKAVAPATGAPEQVLKVPTRTIDNLMRLVGELSISVGQMQDRIKHLATTARLLTENDFATQQKTFELENLVDIRGVTGVKGQGESGEDEEFDPLEMEEYNELHSVAHSFIESISDSREMGMTIRQDLSVLDNMLVQHERLNREFQNSVMTTRMLPATTIIQKLQRNVRQTSRATGKKAKLDVHGSDIMVDSDVLNKLADPLMHIIRNAIDHGLEPNDEREILGKSAEGTVKLEFYREGNFIVVSCKDDGQGLNYTNIRYTAIQRGLITETQELSEAELGRLILMSGFSTKQGVTQTSGRGVGMDVVHTNVREMKGTIDLVSKTGEGTTILLKLPMSLVTVHVFLARIGKKRFAIPTNSLERALAPGTGELQTIGDEIFFKIGKTNYEIKLLSDLLGISGDVSKIEESKHSPIVLVHEETRVSAVVIDELMDSRDLVMKSMGQYVAKVRGVAGASILGDGTVVPLLDLPELLRSPMQSMVSSYVAEQPSEGGIDLGGDSGAPNIMVVDDSLSVRKSLTLLLENEGFEVLLAKDGVEAVELLQQKKPRVMLVDMEMPRMNGLELTSHVRASAETKNMPIFMITSRTTEKHRKQAEDVGVNRYLTKPYLDTELVSFIEQALN